MRDEISTAMKEALKAKEQLALGTMRLISAALKDRDIAARSNGNAEGISDDEILGLLQTMIKQRNESAKMYRDGHRPELAEIEEHEIAISSNSCHYSLMRLECRWRSILQLPKLGPARLKIWVKSWHS